MAITKISSALIGANTIATANIADNAVDGTKIAQNSILTKHIDDAQITTGHLADDAVTLAKLAGLARGKIIYGDSSGNPAALAIGSNGTVLKSDGTDIAWGTDATVAALTSEEVQDIAGAMFSSNTETGITATYQDGDGTIDLVIGANVIVAGMIAQNSILSRHIDDAQVLRAHIADDAVNSEHIADDVVNSQHYVDGSIDTAHIADAQITSGKIAANTIATGNIADNAVDGTKIASNSILTRHIDDNQVTGDQLADSITIASNLTVTGDILGSDIDLDASGDINLDAGGGDWRLRDDGASIATISNVSGDLQLLVDGSDKDYLFKVNDGGSQFTALQIDASDSGQAIVEKSSRVKQVAITSSSNAVAWDACAAANAYHVTTENTTFSAPSNAKEGAIISVELAQGGTARTIGWNTVFEFAASTAPTVTATANKTDIFSFRYNGSVWQEIGRVQNMAQT